MPKEEEEEEEEFWIQFIHSLSCVLWLDFYKISQKKSYLSFSVSAGGMTLHPAVMGNCKN